MKKVEVSRATLGRIPAYLRFLKNLKDMSNESENISATALARQMGLGEVQVRKDLGSVSGAGRPKTGYNISELILTLESFLTPSDAKQVVLAGAGKIGRALLDYTGFSDYGLSITAAFDIAFDRMVESKSGKPIYPMRDFERFCRDNKIEIGIIAVPSNSAQEVCDLMVKSGIRGIWCFAPQKLSVPGDVTVQYENMALSLAYLSKNII